MPLTLSDFLDQEPSLKSLRCELAACDRHSQRELERDEAALVKLLTSQWDNGVAGWMTEDEAKALAAELTGVAKAQKLYAWAEVRDGYLVFGGGRHGEQLLALKVTSPIRARKHWPGYLSHYAPQVTQLSLLDRVIDGIVGWSKGKKGQRR